MATVWSIAVTCWPDPASAQTQIIDPGVYDTQIKIDPGADLILNGPISAGPNSYCSTVKGTSSVHSITVNGTITRDVTGDRDCQPLTVLADPVSLPGTSVGSFTNNGTLLSEAAFGGGFVVWGDVDHFINNGRIQGSDGVGTYILGDAPDLTNGATGVITGGLTGLNIIGGNGAGINIVNYGLISGTGDYHLIDPSLHQGSGIWVRADSTIVNHGTISSQFAGGLVLGNGTVVNSGLITGVVGILERTDLDQPVAASKYFPALPAISHTAVTITNSGQIVGTGGVAIDLGGATDRLNVPLVSDDTLVVEKGSSIAGLVDFGAGSDLLDISQFTGSMVLDTRGLEQLKLDANAPVDFSTFNSTVEKGELIAKSAGTIAVIDASSVSGGPVAVDALLSDVTGQVATVLSDQLDSTSADSGESGVTASAVLGYAAPMPQSAAASAATGEARTADQAYVSTPDRKVWISGFGGGSRDFSGTALSSLFGGIVLGSHAQLDASNELGITAGFVQSDLRIGNGKQTIDTATPIVGGYGRSHIDLVTVDFSVLGGYGVNHSARDTGGGGTATADFSSWFVTPQVGLDIPVLSHDGGDVDVGLQAKYVFGTVSGYSETGSLANLTVSATPISVLDLRAFVTGSLPLSSDRNGAKLTAKTGVFAQTNLGPSDLKITVLGQMFDTSRPHSVLYGPYASVGLDAPFSPSADFTATVTASARSDGMVAASAKAQLAASF